MLLVIQNKLAVSVFAPVQKFYSFADCHQCPKYHVPACESTKFLRAVVRCKHSCRQWLWTPIFGCMPSSAGWSELPIPSAVVSHSSQLHVEIVAAKELAWTSTSVYIHVYTWVYYCMSKQSLGRTASPLTDHNRCTKYCVHKLPNQRSSNFAPRLTLERRGVISSMTQVNKRADITGNQPRKSATVLLWASALEAFTG